MAIPVRALTVFAAVIAGAGLFTATGLSMTSGVVATPQASLAVEAAASPAMPSYMSRMPDADAAIRSVARVEPAGTVVREAPAPVILPPPVDVPVIAEVEVAPAPSFTHRVIASGANVRSGPRKTYEHVFTLPNGSLVTVGENEGGWLNIKDEGGREGWVYQGLLEAIPQTVAVAQ